MVKLIASISLFLVGTMPVMANEYPTEETVRYALNCMADLGGQTDQNLYTCSCRYDALRTEITFSDYEEAITFERNKKMPGEKGGAVRDNQRAKAFFDNLVKAREVADKSCITVKKVKLIKPTNNS
jgi:hypothetical protein